MVDYNIQVKIDPTGAKSGGDQVEGALLDIDKVANRVKRNVAGLFGGAALVAGVRASVRLLRDYGQEMSTVRAVTGATGTQFELLNDQAKELGQSTRFSAAEAASGMTFLARAGFEVQEIYEALPGTLQLAQAGNLGLARSADIASNVLQGFRLETDQTGRVVDVLAKASNSSNTSVEQLGQALSFVAPVAAGLNISLEQTTAAIGALSDAGIQGSRAGTGLSRVLAELESPGTRAQEIFGALGVSMDQVRPSSAGLTGALKALTDAGLTTAQALEIFGQRGGPAFAVLASSIPNVETLEEKLNNAAGTAERMALIMDDNLNGAALAFRSAVQGLVLELGDQGIVAALKGAIAGLTEFFRFLTANADKIFDVFQGLVILIGVRLALGAVPAAISAIKTLTLVIAANPIGFVVTALTTAVVLLIGFADKISLGADRLGTLEDFAVVTFGAIIDLLTQVGAFFGSVFDGMGAKGSEIFGDLEFSFAGVIKGIAIGIDFIIGAFLSAGNVILATWNNMGSALGSVMISAVNATITAVEYMIQKIVDGINAIVSAAENVQKFFLPQSLESDFARIQDVSLGRLENGYEGAGQRFSQALSDGIRDGMEFSGVQGFVDGIFEGAEARAAARNASEAAAANSSIAGTGVGLSNTGTDVAQFNIDKERQALIDDTTQSIIKQTEALSLRGDERERYLTVLNIEDQIADKLRNSDLNLTEAQITAMSKLTDAERARVEVLTQERLESERRATILDDLNGSIDSFLQKQTALNQLMAAGLITQREYNLELNNTALAQGLNNLDQQLGGQFGQDAETQLIIDQYASRQQLLDEALEARLISEEGYKERSLEIEEDRQRQLRELEAAQYSLALQSAEDTFGSLADIAKSFAGEQSGIYKAMFAVSKAFAIADSIIKIQQGIANALALPFPANIAAAAGVAAQAASIVSNIQAVALKFADGGQVHGPGSGTSDSILARLSDGEFVVNAKSTSEYLPLLEAINADKFATGGRVGRSAPRSFGNLSMGQQQPMSIQMGDTNIHLHGTTNQEDAKRAGQTAAKEFEAGVMKVINKQMRQGGKLEKLNG